MDFDLYLENLFDMSEGSSTTIPSSIEADSLPFKPDAGALFVVNDMSLDSVMTKNDAKQKMEMVYRKAQITDNTEKTVLFNNIIMYYILNGASPQANYRGHWEVGGKQIQKSVVGRIMGSDVRRFCRFYADYAKLLMQSKPEVAQSCASKMGLPSDLDCYAFDFAEFCSDVTPTTLDKLTRSKKNALRRASAYGEVKDTHAGDGNQHQQNLPPVPSGSGNYEY